MSLFLKRDTKVYLEKTGTPSVIWEIPVLDGFTFTQSNTTSEITLNEMASPSGASRRGRRMFNDALDPAEWSFSSYVRPFTSAGNGGTGDADVTAGVHHAVEEALWAHFVGTGTPGNNVGAWDYTLANLTADSTDLNVAMSGSALAELGTFNLYFVMGAQNEGDTNYDDGAGSDDVLVYKLSSCVVNEATINYDVDGIAMIDWSGMASTLAKVSTFDASAAVTEGISDTDNFIRNKLTSLEITAANTTNYPGASSDGVYNITITGGSITFSNNITYLTPETLGIVNTPIGHITGNKSITGNFTAYLEEDSGTDTSGQLIADALADTDTTTNSFALVFTLGGAGNTPSMEVSLPTAHLEIPDVQTDDVIAIDVAFHGIPSSIESNDEMTITYKGTS